MKVLERELRQICSLYFEGWQSKPTKQSIFLRFLDLIGELLLIVAALSLFSFFHNVNLFAVLLGILLFITSLFITRLGENLQERNQAKSADKKEDLIGDRFTEAAMHLTIIEKQDPLNNDEKALIMTLANLSVLTPTTGRDEMVSSLLEEATRTRLIKLSLFKALCQKFQVDLKPL